MKPRRRGSYQRGGVKLRDHVMEKGSQVGGAGLQQLEVLETAALAVDLRGVENTTLVRSGRSAHIVKETG